MNIAFELVEYQGQRFRLYSGRRLRSPPNWSLRLQGMLQATAPPTMPALDLFNAAKAKGVAVFFVTGRRDKERQATLWNLDRAGYEGWAKLINRPDDDARPTIAPFKTEERRKIAASGYTIIADVGDQQSDLGSFAECTFKVPNPFYFIP